MSNGKWCEAQEYAGLRPRFSGSAPQVAAHIMINRNDSRCNWAEPMRPLLKLVMVTALRRVRHRNW